MIDALKEIHECGGRILDTLHSNKERIPHWEFEKLIAWAERVTGIAYGMVTVLEEDGTGVER